MFKLLYTVMLCYLVFTFAFSKDKEQIQEVEAKIMAEICSAITGKNADIKVYLTENMKYITKYSKIFVPVKECKDADVVVAGKEIQNCKEKIMVVTKYYLLKNYDNAVAAFYWHKGRPNIIFIKERLESFQLTLPETFIKYVDSEKNL